MTHLFTVLVFSTALVATIPAQTPARYDLLIRNGRIVDMGRLGNATGARVNELGIVDLPFAIRSMTSLPASFFGLKDRGVLRPGAWADVLIFDPAKVRTRPPISNRTRWRKGSTTRS